MTLTTISVHLQRFTPTGATGVAGQWTWTPSRRLRSSTRVVVAAPIVFTTTPDEVTSGAFLLTVAPTDTTDYTDPWCWTVREPGGHVRHVLVPTSDHLIDYAALQDVDPVAYTQTTPPPDWWALFARDQARRMAALEAGAAVADPIPNTPAGVTGYLSNYLPDHL